MLILSLKYVGPQFILEDALLSGHGDHTQIICTQPRRVAATSVAERVADEMCDTLGKKVGYQIRMEAKRSSQTKLLFCTTGIILRRLQDDPYLSNISHILVDEVGFTLCNLTHFHLVVVNIQ